MNELKKQLFQRKIINLLIQTKLYKHYFSDVCINTCTRDQLYSAYVLHLPVGLETNASSLTNFPAYRGVLAQKLEGMWPWGDGEWLLL